MERAADMSRPVSGLAGRGFRLEIQALRAIAVVAVLVFHIWPDVLPGGYVGVDVFFVISGFLITGILFKQFQATGSIRVREFYVRRIRRLLPAATVTLVSVALFLPFLPRTQWEENVAGIIASALYVQNWWLANQAVDYLAAEAAPSAIMHFWSLSVEEQYYIAWPLVLLVAGSLPLAWRRRPGEIFSALVLFVVVASFAYCVWLTDRNPSLAYFSTFTRAWELGVGGALAVTGRWRSLPPVARDVAAWVGLGMIVAALVSFDGTTAFPGTAAALPVLGTALVIVGGESARWYSAYAILRRAPFQYFGDISYSLYLWHWPVIIFFGAITGRAPTWLDGLALAAISVALAHQSKALIEDPFRGGGGGAREGRRAAGIAAACIMLSLFAAWSATRPWGTPVDRVPASPVEAANTHPGALALTHGAQAMAGSVIPSEPIEDRPRIYSDRCMSRGSSSDVKICEYGMPEATTEVMVVGDTYAAQWQPALEEVAKANNWRLRMVVKTGCLLGSGIPRDADNSRFVACELWREGVSELLHSDPPETLIVAQMPSVRLMASDDRGDQSQRVARSLADFLDSLPERIKNRILIRGTPRIGAACSAAEDVAATCSRPRDVAVPQGQPAEIVASARHDAVMLDLTDGICGPLDCEAVVGGVAVYRGANHLTATYARSLAPFMAKELTRLGVLGAVREPTVLSEQHHQVDSLERLAVAAKKDNPDYYRDGCHVGLASSEPIACVYGVADSPTKVVLAGDSHAGHWLPALQELARKNGWALYSYTKSACPFSDAPVRSNSKEYIACQEWNRAALSEIISLRPDVLVTSQSRGQRAFGAESDADSLRILAAGLMSRWRVLRQANIEVVAIADTPWMSVDVPDCLSSSLGSQGKCGTDYADATKLPDAIELAATMDPNATVIRVNDYLCDEFCEPVIGGEVVWRDRHHLTATYSRRLAPYLEPTLMAATN